MMIEPFNTAIGILIVIFAGLFAYMSSHIIAERKAGKFIPLPWEKKEIKPDPKNNPDLGKVSSINKEFPIDRRTIHEKYMGNI